MLIVIDTCNIGLAPSPNGGVVINMLEIQGLPGISVVLPIEGDYANQFHTEFGNCLGNKGPDLVVAKSMGQADAIARAERRFREPQQG